LKGLIGLALGIPLHFKDPQRQWTQEFSPFVFTAHPTLALADKKVFLAGCRSNMNIDQSADSSELFN